jgi:hypothetical protein
MSGGKWNSCGPRIRSESAPANAHRELMAFFWKASQEKAAHDQHVIDSIEELRRTNAARRAQDKRDLDEEYRNYIPPIV